MVILKTPANGFRDIVSNLFIMLNEKKRKHLQNGSAMIKFIKLKIPCDPKESFIP